MPKKSQRRAAPLSSQKIPRLSHTGGNWYWKPEKRLRPHWTSHPLGKDEATARAEARRLNGMAAEWLKTEQPAVTPRRAQPRSVGELIELWRAGPMLEKAPRTIVGYRYSLDRLHQEFGHEIAASLTTMRVDEWADTLRKTAPSTLRVVASIGRIVFAWAGRRGYIAKDQNPFREMRVAGGKKRVFRFTWADVRHIINVADDMGEASLGHALAVCFLTVQRIFDVLALTTANITTEGKGAHAVRSLRFVQSKTGFKVDQEWPAELDRILNIGPHAVAGQSTVRLRRPRGVQANAPMTARPLIVSERSGLRWDEKYASHIFRRVIAAAIDVDPRKWRHLKGGTLRDGRRSGFVHGVLNGANVEIICSLSGHTIKEGYEIVEHYLPKTRAAADQASKFMVVN